MINYRAIENEETSDVITLSHIFMLLIISTSLFFLPLLLTSFFYLFAVRATRQQFFPYAEHTRASTICHRRETDTENTLGRDNG